MATSRTPDPAATDGPDVEGLFSTPWLAARLAGLTGTGASYAVALSGGLDSCALLFALAAIEGVTVRALHVDHGLSPNAADWAAHALGFCRELGVPCRSLSVSVSAEGNLEERARTARYKALAAALHEEEYLLTAHHRDDQMETLLLQLLRGAGPAGLAAMPERARLGPGWHLRPLLPVARGALRAYALRHALEYVDDESNRDPRFDRNYLRHEVIPAITRRWPAAANSVVRSAALAADASALLDELARLDAEDTFERDDLDVAALSALAASRTANALRAWLRARGARVPNRGRLDEFVAQLRTAGADRQPRLSYGDVELASYRQRVYLRHATVATPAHWQAALLAGQALRLPAGLGRLTLVRSADGGLAEQTVADGLMVGFRRGGEKIVTTAGGPRRRLKHLLREWGVLPWMRASVPLLFAGERLAAVADLCADAPLMAPPGSAGFRVIWEDRPPLFASAAP